MNDFITSLIRTYVPIGVGALMSWLATRGLDIDPQAGAGLIVFMTGTLQAAYYVVVRLLERQFPQVGWLLGQAKQVKYTENK